MISDIKDYTREELRHKIQALGFEKYRADQIFASVHGKLKNNIQDIIGISKSQKELISETFLISNPICINISESKEDGTLKFLFESKSREKSTIRYESVLISDNNRKTVCISTQAGCNVGCEFCATGKIRLKRNLTPGEIVTQVYKIREITGEFPTNVVYMGMGEPFLNYENVLKSLLILTDKKGIGIPSGKITVSTVGFKKKIIQFADDLYSNNSIRNVKLALSLHSTDNGFRELLIPTAKANKLSEIYKELTYFYKKTGNKVTYEYIYFFGLNDTDTDIRRLVKLSRMIPSNINIIPFHNIDFKLIEPLESLNSSGKYNQGKGKEYSLSISEKLSQFVNNLRKEKVTVNLRRSSGKDINAACGQLVAKNEIKS